jgi:hypothetical protein
MDMEPRESDSQGKESQKNFSFGAEIARLSEINLLESKPIALHGTSIETLRYVAKNGSFPLTPEWAPQSSSGIRSGDIFVYPVVQNFPKDHPVLYELSRYSPGFSNTDMTEEEWVEATAGYAEDVAKKHALVDTLDLSLANRETIDSAIYLFLPPKPTRIDYKDYNYAINYFESLGKNLKEIEHAIQIADERKGVIIGLNNKILRDFEPEIREDLAFNTLKRGGLGLEYISAIQPMGDYEREFLRELKK